MKNLFIISEEEKERILNIHESATKRQYLSEQPLPPSEPIIVDTNDKAYDYKFENGEYTFRGKPGTKFGQKYPNWQPSKTEKGKLAIKNVIDTKGKILQTPDKPVEKPTSIVDPSKASQETSNVNKSTVENPVTNVTEIPSTITQPNGDATKQIPTGNNFSETDLNNIIV